MAGTVFKQCRYKGCQRSPRCKHPWWLSFSKHGKRYRMKADDFAKKPVPSKAEAGEIWLPKFIAEIREGRDPASVEATPAEMTVGEFVPFYIERHCEAEGLNMDSLRNRLAVIARRFGAEPLRALQDPEPIEELKADLLGRGRAPATVNRYLAQLRHMINWAIDRGLMDKTPFLGRSRGIRMLRENNHRHRRLQGDEEAKLLAAAAAADPLMRARLIVALDTGMRRGEMLLVQNKDVLWPERLIRVLAPNTKSRKERKIPISTQRLSKVLEQRAFLGPDAYIVGGEFGEPQQDFRGAWLKVMAGAGITDTGKGVDGGLHWHDLRHECGSRLAERGVPLHEIQYLMGHASLTTTQRYLNATVESLKESVKVLEQQVG
jgi:integrase